MFDTINVWRKNNNIITAFKTDKMLLAYMNYKRSSQGLNSKLMGNMLMTDAKRVRRFFTPSYGEIKRNHNYYSLTSAGKKVIIDLDHSLKFAGFDFPVPKMTLWISDYCKRNLKLS